MLLPIRVYYISLSICFLIRFLVPTYIYTNYIINDNNVKFKGLRDYIFFPLFFFF